MFDKELEFFKKNQADLVAKFKGKILVIKGSELVGAFDSVFAALNAGNAKFEPGTFMLQPCAAGEGAYSITVNSSI